MVEFLFLDLDDTILDFQKAEHIALQASLQEVGVTPTDAVCARYRQINKEHWEALERGEMTRQQVSVGRFATLFRELGSDADAPLCAKRYIENLALGNDFLPGAQEAVERLFKKYKLYIASNGTKSVQTKRLASTDLEKYFQDIFISQDLGADKPSMAFFQRSFARIPDFDPQKAMIVGDSLSSDIQGGINAGIRTCWVNPTHKASGAVKPDYEIESITQLEELLKTI